MQEHLDHLRARFAENIVHERFKDCRRHDDKPLKPYRSIVLNAVPFLRQCGLLQVFAFWYSKGGGEGKEDKHVLHDVLSWLASPDSALTSSICDGVSPKRAPVSDSPEAAFGPLLARTSIEIAVLEAEAEAYLTWLKRLVEGRYQELKHRAQEGA